MKQQENNMTNITTRETTEVTQQPADLISIIGRLASDPNADINKMERILSMHHAMQERHTQTEFNNALANVQAEMPVITRRGKGRTNDYAKWEDLNEKTKPVLAKHGFSLSFRCDNSAENFVRVIGTLRHRCGHSIEADFDAPIEIIQSREGRNVINGSQARGSAMSYGKRYVTIGLLNISTVGEDDDAYSTTADFDTTPWTEQILSCQSMDELRKVASGLRSEDMPQASRTLLQSAWAGRAKEIQNTESSDATN